MYKLLNENKSVYTLDKLKKYFDIKINNDFLYSKLIESYDKTEIDYLLKKGVMSKPEKEFYFILTYYFDKKNIKKQFKII